ncbi:hypothetical protein TRFO_39321 [Tritrichomonas foetus]|uniref:Uncharacterized protein n=1 Tax=Tritrichomonas foetus TaxID=1144522 RepID=A0A1J4J5J4_9EUKA|nr:hypothetical protein TRFO_39321 [Tritrichomonas foetus]|eukprot:OHS94528.1 hypothetical protein TRFO_39321 [Tritrichomonas foetus]
MPIKNVTKGKLTFLNLPKVKTLYPLIIEKVIEFLKKFKFFNKMMFARLNDYFTPELQAMINEPTTKVQDVLALPYIAQSARVGFPRLIQFLSQHSEELLRIAFTDEKDKLSKTAYTILLMGDKDVLNPILQNYSFRTVATELLIDPNVQPIMIGRLSSLTLACLRNLSDSSKDSFGFLFHLLPHCGNPSVFNFFESICGDDPIFQITQQMLNDMGFSIFVFREFEQFDVKYQSTEENVWKDPTYVRYLCLYKLITQCCENPILCKDFRKPELVELLSKDFENSPDFIKSAKWAAISAATSSEIAVPLLKLIPEASDLLVEHFEKLKAYRVSALEFITKMMKLAPLTFDLLLKSSMPQMLISVVFNFPNSTILHNAFINFVATGLENAQFALKIVSIYTPVIIDCAEEGVHRILLPCCMKMMTLFIAASKKDRQIVQAMQEAPGFDNFVKKTMKNYMTIIQTSYGDDGPTALFKKMKTIFS